MISGENREWLVRLIAHLESTGEADWCVDVVRNDDGNCVMGHVFSMGGDDQKTCNVWWNWFEEAVASTYMIYPVNDGEHPDYQQASAKERVLAYLNDVLAGKRKTSGEYAEEEYQEYIKRERSLCPTGG